MNRCGTETLASLVEHVAVDLRQRQLDPDRREGEHFFQAHHVLRFGPAARSGPTGKLDARAVAVDQDEALQRGEADIKAAFLDAVAQLAAGRDDLEQDQGRSATWRRDRTARNGPSRPGTRRAS